MKTLTKIVIGTMIGIAAFTGNAKGLTRTDGERIVQNVMKELFGKPVQCYKRLYYDGTELRFAAYLDQQLINAAFLGIDYMADSTETPENRADYKSNLYGAYCLNCQAADSVGIRTEIFNYLVGKVDPVVATEQTTWGAIKSLYR